MLVIFLLLFALQNWRPTEQFLVSETHRCQKCKIDPKRHQICTRSDVIVCPSHEPYCMNTFLKFGSTEIIAKRCATGKECESFISHPTANNATCDQHTGFINADHGQCHYCCKTKDGAAMPCNFDNLLKPAYSLTTAGNPHVTAHHTHHHTTSSTTHRHTQKVTTPTTKASTRHKATTTASSTPHSSQTHGNTPGGNICQKCTSGRGKTCSPNDVVFCPQDEPYCLNTFFTFAPTEKILNKRCAKVKECHFFALDLSANKHNCSISPGFPSEEFKQCHYCCKTEAGAVIPCNLNNIPIPSVGTTLSVSTAASTIKPTTTSPTRKATTTTATTEATTTATTMKATTSPTTTTTKATTTPTTTKATTSPTTTKATTTPTTTKATTSPTTKTKATTVSPTTKTTPTTTKATTNPTTMQPTTKTITTSTTEATTSTSAPKLCSDNKTVCRDDPRAGCPDLDRLYGLCKNKGDHDRILEHCAQYCGRCDELCALKLSTTSAPIITTTAATSHKYHCSDGTDIACEDDPNVNCQTPATKIALCPTSLASKYCPASCGVCDKICPVVTTATVAVSITAAPTTTTMTTLATTQPKSTEKFCHVCSGSDILCELLHHSAKCPSNQPYCMNRIDNYADGSKKVVRSCATQQECEDEWWKKSSNLNECTGYDVNAINTKSFKCSFCCTVSNCNVKVVPDNLYIGNCFQCGDPNRYPCSSSDIYGNQLQAKSCPKGSPFCMTEMRIVDGNLSVFKRCAEEQECRHLWLQQTSDKEYCVHYGNVLQSGSYNCFFCCQGDECNKGLVPPNNNTLYTGR